jgi:hypothetical protein
VEFFRSAEKHYAEDFAWMLKLHVTQKILKEMVAEQNVPVNFGHDLNAIHTTDACITAAQSGGTIPPVMRFCAAQ